MIKGILNRAHAALKDAPSFLAFVDDGRTVSSHDIAEELEGYRQRASKCTHLTGQPPTYTGFKFCPKCGEEL